jgi:NAD+ synthase (glutamine-hydrolysing)
MRVALAQLNLSVGDIEGNASQIAGAISRARDAGAQVVALPELAITGYPPEDLVLKQSFVDANVSALESVARHATDVLAVIGFVQPSEGCLFNSAAICHGGKVAAVYRKQLLPNYGVFDERRYFSSGHEHVLVETAEGAMGVTVCEDAWEDDGPVVVQGRAGAGVIVNINASPFHKGKLAERTELLADRARSADASIVYVNLVGGQDELVFDGGSLVVGPDGAVTARMAQFEEGLEVVDVPLGSAVGVDRDAARMISIELRASAGGPLPTPASPLSGEQEVYSALCLALRDYVRKNGFDSVALGLSGGIDSSLTATIAADALGPRAVIGIAMPSEYSTSHSIADAKELASNLGIVMLEAGIGPVYQAYLETIESCFGTAEAGVAEENLQARIRGNLLMFASNRYGHLVLATGNKSESACGYATLYGDMAGGFSLIRDVLKTEVYALARYRNKVSHVIPDSILDKAPSAELRLDQKDEDSLPRYDVLDPILEAYIEEGASVDEIVARGADPATVAEVIALVDRAEYKRRQAPPGPKVTTKAFGRDRRLPISNAWREAPIRAPARVVGEHGPDR